MLLSHLIAASEIVESVDDAFRWIFAISLFFIAGITVAMILFVVRYRHKKSPEAEDIHGSMKLEITWIVIPTIIVLFMFYKGFQGFWLMRHPPDDAMPVEVTGQQWYFTFHYPDADVTTSELYVPVNTPVKLLLSSKDVIHSLYIPHFRTKEDCVPGYVNHMWFQAEKPGEHTIFCAEFCGKDHSRMHTKVVVLEKDAFQKWLTARVQERFAPIVLDEAMDPNAEAIQKRDAPRIFRTYCISCHGPEGHGGLVDGARNFHKLDDKWKNGPTLSGIFTTLTEGLPGTQMRSFSNLSAWDRFALAHFVRGFAPPKELPPISREKLEKLVEKYQLDKQKAVPQTFPIEEAMKREVEEDRPK